MELITGRRRARATQTPHGRGYTAIVVLAATVALVLLVSPRPAHALVCSSTFDIGLESSVSDCAGQELSFGGDGIENETTTFSGSSWVSDLHITFNDSSVVIDSANFQNTTDNNVQWVSEIDNLTRTVWFVAPSPADILDPGDDFLWVVNFHFDNGALNSLNLTIEYTMDIPEPTTMGLFLVGLAGFGLVAMRRRRQDAPA